MARHHGFVRPRSRHVGTRRGALAALAAVTVLAGCGAIPADPDGTLDAVRGGVLRVGAVEHDGWLEESDEGHRGRDAELVRSFAAELDASVDWQTGPEHELVARLEEGALDLVVGGIPADAPWTDRTGVSRPYGRDTEPDGRVVDRVMLVPRGENAFLLELDRLLAARSGS